MVLPAIYSRTSMNTWRLFLKFYAEIYEGGGPIHSIKYSMLSMIHLVKFPHKV